MTKHRNPTADLDNLRLLVSDYESRHGPLSHSFVREERQCERCKMLKKAKQSLANLEAHRAEINNILDNILDDMRQHVGV